MLVVVVVKLGMGRTGICDITGGVIEQEWMKRREHLVV